MIKVETVERMLQDAVRTNFAALSPRDRLDAEAPSTAAILRSIAEVMAELHNRVSPDRW